MSVKSRAQKRKTEKMSNMSFRMMMLTFSVIDFLYPYIGRRVKKFGINEGILIVDDGHQPCGVARQKILDSGLWDIVEETRDHLKCRPR